MPETLPEAPETDQDKLPAMGFLEHLEELRRRIIYCLIALAVGFFACWGYAEKIYGVMQRPIMAALHSHGMSEKLVYLDPTEPFNIYLKVAALAGLFVTSPFILYQVWAFISPGLYRNEKRYVIPFMVSTVSLFLAGGYFGYKLVYPQALEFLIGFGKQFQPMITIEKYTDLFLVIIIGMGAIFEMPILVFFLSLDGDCDGGLDVAQPALLDSGDFHHCRDSDAHDRHSEYVHLRRPHGGALHFEHRDCLYRASNTAPSPAGEESPVRRLRGE